MRVTATEAKNRFGAICTDAKIAPVFVEKDGRIQTVIVSIEQYDALRNADNGGALETRRNQFEKKYAGWIRHQNAQFEERGVWSEDSRTW
jgi:hypothetical protein